MISYCDMNGIGGVSGLYSLCTDRVTVDGLPDDCKALRETASGIEADYAPLHIGSVIAKSDEAVFTRDDTLTNNSDEPVTVYRAYARFALPDGEYDVYTQFDGWEGESRGGWQPLISSVSAENRGLRATQSAAPMMALFNRQTGRGMAFHLFSTAAWRIGVTNEAVGAESRVILELGVNEKGLRLTLAPHESIALPKIVYYAFRDRSDLECHRLHAWFNRSYPQTRMPLLFNTWMATFDRLNPEHIMEEAALAAKIGAEYFVIDAGWFGGDGRWHDNIGAWQENLNGGFCGRMKEVADRVRSLGMTFGLWLEIERALPGVAVVKEHPDWFFGNGREYFVDFGHPEARKYYEDTVISLAKTYGIGFIKFDFNADLSLDPTGSGFLRWHRGHEAFLRRLREEVPGIYLENCASGGLRMDLYNASIYDSCWISDNHGLYDQLRIVTETALRLPPCRIEKWPVLRDAASFLDYNHPESVSKLIACDNATWSKIRGVSESWLKTLVQGGVLGFSFDLKAISNETLDFIASLIADYKKNRADTMNAVCRVLGCTERLTALQYTSPCGDITLSLFAWQHRQMTATLYPRDLSGCYLLNGEPVSAETLEENGITVALPAAQDALTVSLKKIQSST